MSSALTTRPASGEAQAVPWASAKLQDHHLKRLAIVYVRQSSAHQVQENRESTARQYGLVERAVQLGWADVSNARVLVPNRRGKEFDEAVSGLFASGGDDVRYRDASRIQTPF